MQDKVSKPKPRMVRKQILLEREQSDRLRARSIAMGRPEGQLIREALDAWLVARKSDEDDWKAGFRQAAGMWEDRADLDELYAGRRQRRGARRQRFMPRNRSTTNR